MPRIVETATLGAHRAAWDALVRAQPFASPFLCAWWLEAPGPVPPVLVLVVEGDELLGGLALQRDRLLGVARYTLRHQGVLCPDHLDLVARRGDETTVAEELETWLRSPGSRVLDLAGLRGGSALGRLVGPQRPLDVAPYAASPKVRTPRSVRRARATLERAGLRHRRVPPEGLDAAWDDLRRLHADREGRAELLAELDTLRRAVAAAGAEARLDVIGGPTDTVAVSVAFTVAGRLSLYQLARSLDPAHDGAGTVLLHAVIADAVAAGVHEVDLLRGDEPYKAAYADARRTLGRATWGVGRGRPVAAAIRSARTTRRGLGRVRRVSRRGRARGRAAA